MSGKKITGIILVILGLIGSYYYIGGYLELKNQFGNVFGMADKVLNTYLPMMIASVAFFILGIFLLIKANQEEMNDDSNINSSQSKLSRLGAPHPDTHVKCPDCRGFVLMEASACQHCGCKLIPQGIVQTSNNNLNLSPKQGPSFSLQIFDGDKSLENDAYKIYLVKKYGIEKNDALGKIICQEKLFDNVDDALSYTDSLENSLNDEYKNYLIKKYSIEKNDTLGKFIVGDKLFNSIEEALSYADSLEKSLKNSSNVVAIEKIATHANSADFPEMYEGIQYKKAIIKEKDVLHFANDNYGFIHNGYCYIFLNLFALEKNIENFNDYGVLGEMGLVNKIRSSVEPVSINSNQNSISDSSLKNQVAQEDNLTKNGLIICSIVILIGGYYYLQNDSCGDAKSDVIRWMNVYKTSMYEGKLGASAPGGAETITALELAKKACNKPDITFEEITNSKASTIKSQSTKSNSPKEETQAINSNKLYNELRNEILSSGWKVYKRTNEIKGWTNKPYPEIDTCDEDYCITSFISSDGNKVREVGFGYCSTDRYIRCPNKLNGFEIVQRDVVISKSKSDSNFLENKRRAEH